MWTSLWARTARHLQRERQGDRRDQHQREGDVDDAGPPRPPQGVRERWAEQQPGSVDHEHDADEDDHLDRSVGDGVVANQDEARVQCRHGGVGLRVAEAEEQAGHHPGRGLLRGNVGEGRSRGDAVREVEHVGAGQ